MLAVESASFMVVVPIWGVHRVHTWTMQYATEVVHKIFLCLHIVSAISPFCAYLYVFTVASLWSFRSSVIASAPTGCYFQLFS